MSICFPLSCYVHLLFYGAHLTFQQASHLTICPTNQCFRNMYNDYCCKYFILRCSVKLQLKSGAFVSYAWLCILLVLLLFQSNLATTKLTRPTKYFVVKWKSYWCESIQNDCQIHSPQTSSMCKEVSQHFFFLPRAPWRNSHTR